MPVEIKPMTQPDKPEPLSERELEIYAIQSGDINRPLVKRLLATIDALKEKCTRLKRESNRWPYLRELREKNATLNEENARLRARLEEKEDHLAALKTENDEIADHGAALEAEVERLKANNANQVEAYHILDRANLRHHVVRSEQETALRQAREALEHNNWTEDFADENGNYQNTCSSCGEKFLGHKRRVTCKGCAALAAIGKVMPK